MKTTIGQLLVNQALPEDFRDYSRTLDKSTLKKVMSELAQKHPDKYREVSHRLLQIGKDSAYTTGGNSFGLAHLRKAKAAKLIQDNIRKSLTKILADDTLSDDARDKKIIETVGKHSAALQKAVYDESLAEENPFARQVASGSRGNPMNLNSLRGGDLLYVDHRDRVLPIPVLRSYSEGLSPLEYWAGTYGARKGVVDTKMATADAGYLSKQLNQISHRALVTALDNEKDYPTLRGFPVGTDDDESEGSLLAHDIGGYKRNTVLTPKVLEDLRRKKVNKILIRSPAVGGPADGGVYARDVGIREFGRMPTVGENVGMAAAQALSEPLSQSQLSSKHGGGVAGADTAVSGFDYINQLVQVPKQFKGGAAHADVDGLVQRVEDGFAGGKNVWIENQRHYVGKGYGLKVKKGDKVEAGDVISEGFPNPAIIVKHKGIGEGRRYFIDSFRKAFRDAGIKSNRRNIELLSRGLINHVRLLDEVGDYVPDDIIPYSQLEHSWKPRKGYQTVAPKGALGKYLERPYLHYSIGDRVRPSMLKNFDEFGIKEVDVHDEEPPFQAEMMRGMANLQHDPDWVTRMFGSGQKTSVLDAVHRGGTSTETGTSFVPGLAHGVNFNRIGKVQTPKSSITPMGKLSAAAQELLEKHAQDPGELSLEEADPRIQELQQSIDPNVDRQTGNPNIYDVIDRTQYAPPPIKAERALQEARARQLESDPYLSANLNFLQSAEDWFSPAAWARQANIPGFENASIANAIRNYDITGNPQQPFDWKRQPQDYQIPPKEWYNQQYQTEQLAKQKEMGAPEPIAVGLDDMQSPTPVPTVQRPMGLAPTPLEAALKEKGYTGLSEGEKIRVNSRGVNLADMLNRRQQQANLQNAIPPQAASPVDPPPEAKDKAYWEQVRRLARAGVPESLNEAGVQSPLAGGSFDPNLPTYAEWQQAQRMKKLPPIAAPPPKSQGGFVAQYVNIDEGPARRTPTTVPLKMEQPAVAALEDRPAMYRRTIPLPPQLQNARVVTRQVPRGTTGQQVVPNADHPPIRQGYTQQEMLQQVPPGVNTSTPAKELGRRAAAGIGNKPEATAGKAIKVPGMKSTTMTPF